MILKLFVIFIGAIGLYTFFLGPNDGMEYGVVAGGIIVLICAFMIFLGARAIVRGRWF